MDVFDVIVCNEVEYHKGNNGKNRHELYTIEEFIEMYHREHFLNNKRYY